MKRLKPPFRADHVGSLLRSTVLKEARAKREQGAITAQDLKAIEDREIAALIAKQAAAAPDPFAHQQEARRLCAASDDRALQVRAIENQPDREDDDTVAVDPAFSLRTRCRAGIDLSRD